MGGAYAFFGFGSSTAYDGTLRLHRERKKRHEALPVSLTSGVPLGDVRDLRPRAHVRGPGVYETATQRPHDLRPRAHRNRSRCVKKTLAASLVARLPCVFGCLKAFSLRRVYALTRFDEKDCRPDQGLRTRVLPTAIRPAPNPA